MCSTRRGDSCLDPTMGKLADSDELRAAVDDLASGFVDLGVGPVARPRRGRRRLSNARRVTIWAGPR
jgi:hypothetical protein